MQILCIYTRFAALTPSFAVQLCANACSGEITQPPSKISSSQRILLCTNNANLMHSCTLCSSYAQLRGITANTAPFKDIDFATQLFMQAQCKNFIPLHKHEFNAINKIPTYLTCLPRTYYRYPTNTASEDPLEVSTYLLHELNPRNPMKLRNGSEIIVRLHEVFTAPFRDIDFATQLFMHD